MITSLPSWLQPLTTFLRTKTANMHTVEDAVHQVYIQHISKVRMASDWMDFSVEHMSKWWKTLDSIAKHHNSVSIDRINEAFLKYISSSPSLMPSPSVLHPTIAILPFASYVKKDNPTTLRRSTNLTIFSLGATLASMARVGFGRIVVVGVRDGDERLVQKAFRLQKASPADVQFAYVQVQNETWYQTKFIPVNVPVAAVVGLQHALNGNLPEEEANMWLGGDKGFWKYVYLTEPDTILQTRAAALMAIHDALEHGVVLMPHRLQPIPHYSDVSGTSSTNYLKPLGAFAQKAVIEISNQDACCDEGVHPNQGFPDCGNFWYLCGHNNRNHNAIEHNKAHKRLIPYNFIRIRDGVGIVSIAGSEHGRTCRPEKMPGYACKSPMCSPSVL